MLNIKNNKLYFGDKPFFIIEANSPESRLRDLHYPELDELNSYEVNTIYASVNAKESAYTLNPFINNDVNQGYDFDKVNKWRAYLEHWVFGYPGKIHIVHLLLSEKETHYLLSEAQHKAMIDYLVAMFRSLEGYIIWDREELDTGKQAYINTYYSYLKQVDPKNIRACHNNTNEDPWNSFESSDLIQFLSLQEWEGNFGRRIDELTSKGSWAAYVSEKTGGFNPGDKAKVEPLVKCSPYNSGIGFYITKDHSFPSFQAEYKNLYIEANRVVGNTTTTPPNPNTTMPTLTSLQFQRGASNIDILSSDISVPVSTEKVTVQATGDSTTKSVKFELSGPVTKVQTESQLPWYLFGDSNGTPNTQTFPAGVYTLKATPYSGGGATGTAGTPATRTITITSGTTPPPDPTPTKTDIIIDITADLTKVNVITKVNGVTQ